MLPPACAAPRVMTSLALPPVMVSAFETVSVLLPSDESARLSEPAPRLILPEVCAAEPGSDHRTHDDEREDRNRHRQEGMHPTGAMQDAGCHH